MSGFRPDNPDTVRLDRWLWAARFFRTRTLARAAIEGGKVRRQGRRARVSQAVRVGDALTVRQGHDDREIRIDGLSEQRGPAPVARQLYTETPESLERRERRAAERRALRAAVEQPARRPDKHDRRRRRQHKRSRSGPESPP